MVASRQGDEAARRRLVDHHLPMIGSMARHYQGVPAVDRGELMQEGVCGLLRALDRFDLDRGTPFWAYASWWVRQAMQGLVAQVGRPVVLSDRALRQLARVREAQRAHRQRHRREASFAELVELTGVSNEHIGRLLAVDRPPRALDEPAGGEDGTAGTFGDTLADPRSEDPFERVVAHLTGERLRTLPGALCERERVVVRARYGLDGHARTLREIGRELDLSAERVRQIEQGALEKLRATAAGVGRPLLHEHLDQT